MNEMNLTKLFEAQKALDERITEEKGLQGQNLLSQKVVALITELGECANEWRGFKFWSENRKPKKPFVTTSGQGEVIGYYCHRCEDFFDLDHQLIKECQDHLNPTYLKDALLEEYVDIVHFSLSLIIDTHKGQNLPVHIPASRRIGERIDKYFIDIAHSAASILYGNKTANIVATYETLGSVLGLGQALGFTEDQIEAAYFQKNATNHKRQEEHY